MLVIKIIGCLMVMLSGTSIGFLAAGEVLKRIEDLNAFRTIAFLIQGDIRFNHSELPETLANISTRHKSRLSAFLNYIADELNKHNGLSFYEIWEYASENKLNLTALSKEDKSLFMDFGKSMGMQERTSQIDIIEHFINEIDTKLTELRTSSDAKKKLYKTLGFLSGLFIIIVLF